MLSTLGLLIDISFLFHGYNSLQISQNAEWKGRVFRLHLGLLILRYFQGNIKNILVYSTPA